MEYTKFFNFIFFNFMDLFLLSMILLCLSSYFIEKGLIYYYRKVKKIHHRDKVYENIKNLFIGYNIIIINVFYILVMVYIPIAILRLINYFI